MPRWWSICATITVIIILIHTLVSFYQPTIIPTWGGVQSNSADSKFTTTVHPSSPHQDSVSHKTIENHTPTDDAPTTHFESHPVKEPPMPAGPKGEEIVLVVGTDGKSHRIQGMEEMVRQNRQQYASMHGYELMWANFSEYKIGNAHPVWSKVPVLADAFRKYPKAKWLWWLDIDAIIMSPNIDLSTHILSPPSLYSILRKGEAYQLRGAGRDGLFETPDTPDTEQMHLLISGDHNGINAGSFFLRRSDWTDMFLDLWLDPFYIQQPWPGKEQDAIIHMIQHHKFVQEHVGILPQRSINAYCEGDEKMRWHKGDLVVHFAGCWVADKCEERWTEFWALRDLPTGTDVTVNNFDHEQNVPNHVPR